MRRDEVLVRLSRDHQHGLAAALRLRRATPGTALAARDAFLRFWDSEGQEHFRAEEEVLLPSFARHAPPTHEAVVRVLTDHVQLRRRASDLAVEPTPSCADLHALGDHLTSHIRYEERVLFPLIESTLPENELASLAAALAHRPAPPAG